MRTSLIEVPGRRKKKVIIKANWTYKVTAPTQGHLERVSIARIQSSDPELFTLMIDNKNTSPIFVVITKLKIER